ncbi:hypothetical protein J6590_092301 [Homalodisca vitripennis]|nr:hypothetical protein J6590_092301 [Homalodisca vitripennis]
MNSDSDVKLQCRQVAEEFNNYFAQVGCNLARAVHLLLMTMTIRLTQYSQFTLSLRLNCNGTLRACMVAQLRDYNVEGHSLFKYMIGRRKSYTRYYLPNRSPARPHR